jgi:hypothetical protein
MTPRNFSLVILPLSMLLATACGSPGTPADGGAGGSPDGGGVLAGGDGGSNAYVTPDPVPPVQIVAVWNPDPPRTGRNTLTLTLADSNGYGVTGAAIAITTVMTAMGHGSSERPVVTDNQDGTYTATPMTFQMAGGWKVTVKATAGTASASTTLSLTVR